MKQKPKTKRNKYDNKSPKFADWTTAKLKKECVAFDEHINGESWCFGRSDLFALDGIERELDKRGVHYIREMKFKYDCINPKGNREPWSGTFNSFELAQRWYLKHGRRFEARGVRLVLVKVYGSTHLKK